MQTPQQKRELYKKLSQRMRSIVASLELSQIIDDIAKNNNLNKNQRDILAKTIVDGLMEIASKESIGGVIANEIKVDNTLTQKIFDDVENKILNNLDNIYAEINRNIEVEESQAIEKTEEEQKQQLYQSPQTQNPTPQPTKPQNNVGNSFEQIILNQAKAMQPARESREQPVASSKIPENLPTENEKTGVIHNYVPGSDPYREPIE